MKWFQQTPVAEQKIHLKLDIQITKYHLDTSENLGIYNSLQKHIYKSEKWSGWGKQKSLFHPRVIRQKHQPSPNRTVHDEQRTGFRGCGVPGADPEFTATGGPR